MLSLFRSILYLNYRGRHVFSLFHADSHPIPENEWMSAPREHSSNGGFRSNGIVVVVAAVVAVFAFVGRGITESRLHQSESVKEATRDGQNAVVSAGIIVVVVFEGDFLERRDFLRLRIADS